MAMAWNGPAKAQEADIVDTAIGAGSFTTLVALQAAALVDVQAERADPVSTQRSPSEPFFLLAATTGDRHLRAPMTLFILHAAAALFMTGAIWFVQIVHYPLMRRVGGSGFARYEAEHTRRTSPVVAPVMIFELGSGLWLALDPPAALGAEWFWINAAALAAIWISTFTLQVPAHRRLVAGFDERAIERLVASNWVRTAAWSARAILLVFLLLSVVRVPPGAGPSAG